MLRGIDRTGYSKKAAWCGPGALATLTGCPLREATELLSRVSGEPYKRLSGVHNEAMAVALHELGYRMVANRAGRARLVAHYNQTGGVTTLRRFLAGRSLSERANMMLINVTDHYICAHLNWACDNQTTNPVPIVDFPQLRRWVVESWIVERLPH